MKISVNGDPNINLAIPSGLVLNSLTASLLPLYLRKYDVHIPAAQARKFIRALNRYRKAHPEWVLVEVLSSQGEAIRIRL